MTGDKEPVVILQFVVDEFVMHVDYVIDSDVLRGNFYPVVRLHVEQKYIRYIYLQFEFI